MAYVVNPPVPYIGPLTGISQGLIIHIAGQPHPTAKWFAINLQCGPNTNPRDDIALHISPRFEGNTSKIVRNSTQTQQWGIEENYGHFPLAPGQPFEILILVENDHFKIAINGQHYTEFRHRMPLNRVNTLTVDGDVQLHKVHYEGGSAGIPSQMPAQGHVPNPSMPPGQYSQPGYAPPPGAPGYGTQQQQHQPYSNQPPYNTYQTTGAMAVPQAQSGRKSPSWGHVAGAGAGGAALGAVGGYALGRLTYPGHHGHGHGMGMMHGKKGMKKMKKMYKHKHHKPKFHKFHKKHKFHGHSSSSSSSSEEE